MVAAPHGRPVALTLGPPLNLPLGGGGRWLADPGTRCCGRGVAVMGGGRGGSRTASTGAVHNHRHSGESRNPEGPGNGEAHVI